MESEKKSIPTIIKGAKGGGKGGGGGSARVAREAADSLRSKAFARIIDLICEGEIEGLVTGDLKSVYLDETKVQNADGSYNFTGIEAAFRNGTQNQTYIPGFESVEDEKSVGLEVKNSNPVIHTVSDLTIDALRVTIGLPQLTSQNTSNGDINGTSVEIAIDVKPNGGSYEEVISDVIKGKTTTRYQRSYRIDLDSTGPWDIRIRRITADSTKVALQNSTFWDSLTEITNAKLAYPNSALVASVIDAEQFSNIPKRGYDMKLLRTKIPSNASVNENGSLTYSGSWDGTFQIAWHANPAWVFYDMLASNRYGLGEYISEDQIDKWTLYSIGRYCDEAVPDGFGGFEPRFTCNIYLQKQESAYKVLQDLASVFRGMIFWSSGLIVPTQDSPATAAMIYTKANIIDGKFTRSGTSLDTRHSVALVTWNDPADFYSQKVEYVEDAAAIERYGIKETQVIAVGCTSRGQAHRVGRWLLYSEANDTELISFSVGMDSLYVRPGQVMAIQDADRAAAREGGRVISATTTEVTVDSAFTPDVLGTYTLMVMLPDGTIGQSEIININGAVLTLASALSTAPAAGAVWAVTSNVLALEEFRVVGITDLNDGTFEISGLVYNELKYAAVEENIILTPVPTSLINTPPNPVTGITANDTLYDKTGSVAVRITVGWQAPARATSYIFSYRHEDGAIVTINGILEPIFEIENAQEGQYTFYITAVSAIGKRSTVATYTYTAVGKTAVPEDVQNFSLVSIGDGVANLTLSKSVDLDVLIGGYLRVRWSPLTNGVTWTDAVDIGPALPGHTTNFSVPHVSGTFLAKFVDSSGNQSDTASAVTTNIAVLLNSEQVTVIDESPSYSGTRTSIVTDSVLGGLKLSSSQNIDDITALIDTWGSIDYEGGIALSGEYLYDEVVDFGAVYNCTVRHTLTASGFDAVNLIDSRLDLIDDWGKIDGDNVDHTNAQILVSTTQQDRFTDQENNLADTDISGYADTRGVITENFTTAPDGTLTGAVFIEDTATGQHYARPEHTGLDLSAEYTYSIYLKRLGARHVRLLVRDNDATANYIWVNVNLGDGTIINQLAAGNASISSINVEAAPNEWYRVIVTGVVNSAGGTTAQTYLYSLELNENISFTGDGASGFYFYGIEILAGDTAYSPTWADYIPFFVAQLQARALRFKLALTTEQLTHNIVATDIGVTVDIPDRIEESHGISSTTSAKNITFQKAFYGVPGIAINANNMDSGDYYTITNESATGFTIQFFNSAASGVDRNFTYLAKGQGSRS